MASHLGLLRQSPTNRVAGDNLSSHSCGSQKAEVGSPASLRGHRRLLPHLSQLLGVSGSPVFPGCSLYPSACLWRPGAASSLCLCQVFLL